MSVIIRDFLRSDGSIIINKRLAKIIGIDAAVLYSEIISKWIYYSKENKLENDDSFYSTIEDMEKDTTLSVRQQTRAIKILVNANLIEYKVKGLPPRRFFKIPDNEESLLNLLNAESGEKKSQAGREFAQNAQIDLRKTHKTICAKRNSNNTNNNNKANNTKEVQNIAANAGNNKINPLFNFPQTQAPSPKYLNKIQQAEQSGNWKSITATDFADYFIETHNKLFPTQIFRQRSKDGNYRVGLFKKNFLERYKLKPEETCSMIELILAAYKQSSFVGTDYRDRFDLDSFAQEWLISKLMTTVQDMQEMQRLQSLQKRQPDPAKHSEEIY